MSESDLASTCALAAILVEPEVPRGGDLEEDPEDLEDCLCRKFATNMPKELWYRVAPLLCPRARPGRAIGAAERVGATASGKHRAAGQRHRPDRVGTTADKGAITVGSFAECLSTEGNPETANVDDGKGCSWPPFHFNTMGLRGPTQTPRFQLAPGHDQSPRQHDVAVSIFAVARSHCPRAALETSEHLSS